MGVTPPGEARDLGLVQRGCAQGGAGPARAVVPSRVSGSPWDQGEERQRGEREAGMRSQHPLGSQLRRMLRL